MLVTDCRGDDNSFLHRLKDRKTQSCYKQKPTNAWLAEREVNQASSVGHKFSFTLPSDASDSRYPLLSTISVLAENPLLNFRESQGPKAGD